MVSTSRSKHTRQMRNPKRGVLPVVQRIPTYCVTVNSQPGSQSFQDRGRKLNMARTADRPHISPFFACRSLFYRKLPPFIVRRVFVPRTSFLVQNGSCKSLFSVRSRLSSNDDQDRPTKASKIPESGPNRQISHFVTQKRLTNEYATFMQSDQPR